MWDRERVAAAAGRVLAAAVPDGECLVHTGFVNRAGYGTVRVGGRRKVHAHRAVYESVHGQVPDGLVVDHLCRNRRCVRIDHLEAVTNRENLLRGEGPSAVHASKTHCPAGHEYAGRNLIVRRGRHGMFRRCRTCVNEQQRTRRA